MNTNNTRGRSLLLATDGSCLGNPGPGGWAVIVHEREGDAVVSRYALAGRADGYTTNNQMELEAAIAALKATSRHRCPVTIMTDSQYVQKGLTDEVMQELNARVDLDKESAEQVAEAYLTESKLVPGS